MWRYLGNDQQAAEENMTSMIHERVNSHSDVQDYNGSQVLLEASENHTGLWVCGMFHHGFLCPHDTVTVEVHPRHCEAYKR